MTIEEKIEYLNYLISLSDNREVDLFLLDRVRELESETNSSEDYIDE